VPPFCVIYARMSKTILGLDVSSTCIGWALVKEEGGQFSCDGYGYFKPDKKKDLFESLHEVRAWTQYQIEATKPDEIAIEDISEHFTQKSTSKTIIKLAVYNRTVGIAAYEHCNCKPGLMNVNTVRSLIKPKGYRGKLAKTDVPSVVSAIMKMPFPWKYKRNGNIADESYDMADAMAVALAFRAKQLASEKTK